MFSRDLFKILYPLVKPLKSITLFVCLPQNQPIIVVYSGYVFNGVSLTILSAKLKSPQVKHARIISTEILMGFVKKLDKQWQVVKHGTKGLVSCRQMFIVLSFVGKHISDHKQ